MRKLSHALMICLFALVSAPAIAQHSHHHTPPDTARPEPHGFDGWPDRQKHLAQDLSNKPCVDTEKRLSYPGFDHCRLHPQYQIAFKNWDCHCYSGQCRPTRFRTAGPGTTTETGYEILIENIWFPIPRAALRTEKANMTEDLLEYEAHVCTSRPFDKDDNPVAPHIECAWIKLVSRRRPDRQRPATRPRYRTRR